MRPTASLWDQEAGAQCAGLRSLRAGQGQFAQLLRWRSNEPCRGFVLKFVEAERFIKDDDPRRSFGAL